MSTEPQESFGAEQVLERLGITIITKEEEAAQVADNPAALTRFRAAPTIKALGNDADRIASFTSGRNRAGAQVRWRKRRVMAFMDGVQTVDTPLVEGIEFLGEIRELKGGHRDVVVSGTWSHPVKGVVKVIPLYATDGIQYIKRAEHGTTLVPNGIHHGFLYAPEREDGKDEMYRFVPLSLLDPLMINRYNLIVDEGAKLGTVHGKWPKIERIDHDIDKPGIRRIQVTPSYVKTRESHKRDHKGNRVFNKDGNPVITGRWVEIGSWFGKSLVLSEKCQDLPLVDTEENCKAKIADAKRVGKSFNPWGELVFFVRETERGLELTLLGRPGDLKEQPEVISISEAVDSMNPFDVLGVNVERYDPARARRFVDNCLNLPYDRKNPLFVTALNMGLVIEGQDHRFVDGQIRPLVDEAVHKAERFWKQAIAHAWDQISRSTMPAFEECLEGRRLDDVRKSLNKNDVAAAFVTRHIGRDYAHGSPFMRTLRIKVIDKITPAGYTDKITSVTVEPQAQPTSDTSKATEPDKGTNGTGGGSKEPTVSELKARLNAAGIVFKASDRKARLIELVDQIGQ